VWTCTSHSSRWCPTQRITRFVFEISWNNARFQIPLFHFRKQELIHFA
jgi:hypothetical protein